MKVWPVQDAKARFSEMLEACVADGPQLITKRGEEAAVILSIGEWRRLEARARPGLKELLLENSARDDLPLPPRGSARRRTTADL